MNADEIRNRLSALHGAQRLRAAPEVEVIAQEAEMRGQRLRRRLTIGSVAVVGAVTVGGLLVVGGERTPDTVQLDDGREEVDTDDGADEIVPTSTAVSEPERLPATTIARSSASGLSVGGPDGPASLESVFSGTVDVVDATLTDPTRVWRTIEADQSRAISFTFDQLNESVAAFPRFAVSTEPGRSNDYDSTARVVWRTDDGIAWTPVTDFQLERAGFPVVVSDSGVFSVATAPGASGEIEVGGSVIDGAADVPAPQPFVLPVAPVDRSVEGVSFNDQLWQEPLSDGRVLVGHTVGRSVDWFEGFRRSEYAATHHPVTDIAPDGTVGLLESECIDDYFGSPSPFVTETTTPDAPLPNGCAVIDVPIETFGVPAAAVSVAAEPQVTEFFVVSTDGDVEPIASPAPGERLDAAGFGRGVWLTSAAWAGGEFEAWRYSDRWERVDMSLPELEVRARLRRTAFGEAGLVESLGHLTVVGDDATVARMTPLLDSEHARLGGELAAAVGDELVLVGREFIDPIRAAGGVEQSIGGGYMIRLDTNDEPWSVLDDGGARVSPNRLVPRDRGSGTIDVLDDLGRVVATIDQTDVDALWSSVEWDPDPGPAAIDVYVTSDGRSFSKQPIHELLGLEAGDVSAVTQVSAAGDQVVIGVLLEERWSDDTRKQVLLVGTPID